MAKLVQPSFSKGEISPELHGRVDVSAYSIGLATAKNAVVHTYGGISKRPGSKFIGPVRDHDAGMVRLIPFEFKTDDSYILEFGDEYMRVIRNDAHVIETAQNIEGATKADPVVITITSHGYSTGDELLISGVSGMTQLNGKRFKITVLTANTFSLQDQVTEIDISGVEFTTYTSGGTAARIFTVISPYAIEDLFGIKYTQSADVMTLVHKSYPIYELSRTAHTSWTFTELSVTPTVQYPEDITVTVNNSGAVTKVYKVTAILRETGEESLPGLNDTEQTISGATQANPVVITATSHPFLDGDEIQIDDVVGMTELNGNRYIVANSDTNDFELTDVDGNDVDGTAFTAYSSAGIARQAFVRITNSLASEDNTVGWSAVSGAHRYAVYRDDNGIFGLIGETEGLTFDDSNISPDTDITPPVYRDPFNGEDNKPGAVGYFEQRRVFGGSTAKPDTSEFSQTGSTSNFTRSIPAQDDDSITATLTSSQVNEIRHYVARQNLLVFTSGSEWLIRSGSDTIFGPDTIRQAPQSEWGSSELKPITIGNSVLFVTSDLHNIRDMRYSLEYDAYDGENLNIFSRHLFRGYSLIDWCSIRVPDTRVYACRNDGVLLVLAYDREQETIAWTWWQTDGEYESCASLRGGGDFNEDSSYFVVQRTINGNTVRYIEVVRDRFFESVEDCFYVDSGLSYDDTAVDTFTGLEHLEGETVVALADGNVISNLVVSNGTVTLPRDFSVVHIGLPYTSDLKTLKMDDGRGRIQGNEKQISRIMVRFFKSRGMFAGYDSTDLIEMKQRENEDYGDPTALLTGDKEIVIPSRWDTNGQIFIRHTDPLPLTVLMIVPYFEIGDD